MRKNGFQTYGRQTRSRHLLKHISFFSPDASPAHCTGLWNNRKVFDSSAESLEDSFDRLRMDSPSTKCTKKSESCHKEESIEAPIKPLKPWNNRKVFDSSKDSSMDSFDKLLRSTRRSTLKTTRLQKSKTASTCKNKERQQTTNKENSLDSLEEDSDSWEPHSTKCSSTRGQARSVAVTKNIERRQYNLRSVSKQTTTAHNLSSDSDFCSFGSHRRNLKRPTNTNKQRQPPRKVKRAIPSNSESKTLARPPELDYSAIDEWSMCVSPDVFKIPSPPTDSSPAETAVTKDKDLAENHSILTTGSESLFDSSLSSPVKGRHNAALLLSKKMCVSPDVFKIPSPPTDSSPAETAVTKDKDLAENHSILTTGSESLFDSSLSSPVKGFSGLENSALHSQFQSAVGAQTSTPNFGNSGICHATKLHKNINLIQNPSSFGASPIARSQERSWTCVLRSGRQRDKLREINPCRKMDTNAVASVANSAPDPGEQARRNLEVFKKGLMQLASNSHDHQHSADVTKAPTPATLSTANSQNGLKTASYSLCRSDSRSRFENNTRFQVKKSPVQRPFSHQSSYSHRILCRNHSTSDSRSNSTEEEQSSTDETSKSTSSSASLKSHKSQQHHKSTMNAVLSMTFDEDMPLSAVKDILHLERLRCRKNGISRSTASSNNKVLVPPTMRISSRNNPLGSDGNLQLTSASLNKGEILIKEKLLLDTHSSCETSSTSTAHASTSQATTASAVNASIEGLENAAAAAVCQEPNQCQVPIECEDGCGSLGATDGRTKYVSDAVVAVDNVNLNQEKSSASSASKSCTETEVSHGTPTSSASTQDATQLNNSLTTNCDHNESLSTSQDHSLQTVDDHHESSVHRPIPTIFEQLMLSICVADASATPEQNQCNGVLSSSKDENEPLSLLQKHLQTERLNHEHVVSESVKRSSITSGTKSADTTKSVGTSISHGKSRWSIRTGSGMSTPVSALSSKKKYLGSTDKTPFLSLLKERIQLSWRKMSESSANGQSIAGSRPPSLSNLDVSGKTSGQKTAVVKNLYPTILPSSALASTDVSDGCDQEEDGYRTPSQEFLSRRIAKLHHAKEVHRRARKSLMVTLSPRFPKAPVLSSRDIVLQHCNQLVPQRFDDFLSNYKTLVKIGEGAYGEVYSSHNITNDSVAIKVIPVEGEMLINNEKQKTFAEVLPEIAISLTLSNLDNEVERNCTPNFVHLHSIKCVSGKYPTKLLRAWKKYDTQNSSENDNPEIFSGDQLYIAFVFNNAGVDLERYEYCNTSEAFSTFVQVACTLAIAENAVEFEHRDLHCGNILINQTNHEEIKLRLQGKDVQVLSHGIHITLIDFTLSRLKEGQCVVASNLSDDPYIFKGEGDYQYEVYRLMRSKVKDQWDVFCPYTNVLWLHYLLLKLCNEKKYKSVRRADRAYLTKLKAFCSKMLTYASATEFVEDHLYLFQE